MQCHVGECFRRARRAPDRYFSPGAEVGIEHPIGIVAGDGKIEVAPVQQRLPGGHDLPVGLHREAHHFLTTAEVRDHASAHAEAGVDRAIEVEPCEGKVGALIAPPGAPSHDQLSIRLEHASESLCIAAPEEIHRHLSVGAPARIERAAAGEPHGHGILGLLRVGSADEEDLPIGAEKQSAPAIACTAKVDGRGAPGTEGGVE